MKKTTLVTALIVMSASSAMAQQWKHLGSDGAGNHYLYNPKTFNTAKGNIVSAWTRKEYGVDLDVITREKLTPEKYKGGKTTTAFEEFDCAKKKKRTLTGKTVVGGKDEEDLAETGWLEVAPGSLDESLLNTLCREGEKKKSGAISGNEK